MKHKMIKTFDLRFLQKTKWNEIYENDTHVFIQTQLAGMLGVSREHVNRVIRLGHRSQVTPTRKRLQQRNKEVSGCDVNSEASENNINSRSHPDHTLKPLQDNV